MKIECVKEKLREALSLADKVTGKHLTLPVLSCVLLEAKNKQLTVRATNLDLGLEIKVPVKIEKDGVVAVPANILTSFLSEVRSEKPLSLDVVNQNLSVSASGNRTVIKCLGAEDFPTIPSVAGESVFVVEPTAFIKGLRAVWYSAAISSMKPELSSVYVYPDVESLVFVATDSFRLAEKRIKTKGEKDFASILIPFKNVAEIIRVLETASGEVEVHLSKNQIAFSWGGVYLTSRVVEGNFPDYRQIIPKEFKTEAVVLKQDLLQALRLANIFSDNFNQLNIRTDSKGKLLEFKTKNNEVGENTNTLDAALSGDPLDMNFNYKYIVDCLPSIEADSVSLSFSGQNRPLVVSGVGDKSFTYLVMSMNR